MAAQSDYPELRTLFDKNRDVVKMLRSEKQLTEKQIYFSAVYNKLGKKIAESRDRTSLTAFTPVITGRYQVCHPDSITITWHNADTTEKLFEHTFSIQRAQQREIEQQPEIPSPIGFQGLGEVEVNTLVEKRLTEMRQREEYERMREENGKMQVQIAELERHKVTLERDIAAKETTESYMKILGMALPGLSKFFGGAGLLSMLAGTEEEVEAPALGAAEHVSPTPVAAPVEPRDEREEMIFMLKDYMTDELSQQEVATIYLLFMEFQKDKTQIQKILSHLTTNNA
jgi:hypothetical protein